MNLYQIMYVSIFVIFVSSQNLQDYDESTVELVTVETTTEEVIIITDIPQSDVDNALNLDVGEYTTQVFDYINTQFYSRKKHEKCYDHYIKCLLTQGVATPVCAINNAKEIPDGWITYNSFCDLYFDNCRRDIRFWRLLDLGRCYHLSELHGNVEKTKRRLNKVSKWPFIFDVLGSKKKEYKLWPYIG